MLEPERQYPGMVTIVCVWTSAHKGWHSVFPEQLGVLPLCQNPGTQPPLSLLVITERNSKLSLSHSMQNIMDSWLFLKANLLFPSQIHSGFPVITDIIALSEGTSSSILAERKLPTGSYICFSRFVWKWSRNHKRDILALNCYISADCSKAIT